MMGLYPIPEMLSIELAQTVKVRSTVKQAALFVFN